MQSSASAAFFHHSLARDAFSSDDGDVVNFRDKLPSGKALWALLWRSVVFFPLGILILMIGSAAVAAFLGLAIWAIAFALIGRWWEAAACAVGFTFPLLIWRSWSKRADASPADAPGRGGEIFL